MRNNHSKFNILSILLIVGIVVLANCSSKIEYPPDTWEEYMGYSSLAVSSSAGQPSSSSNEPSSSSGEPSSSSNEPSSSSSELSSSSNEPESSSSILSSSSSTEPSSSSGEPSSSSIEPSSSSSEPSSSSVTPSSSSNVPSSSSVTPSSSSIAPSSSSEEASSSSEELSCDGFVNGTKIEHYGMEKEQFCDERDGKKYVYVEIGEQTWMAENLNYEVDGSRCYGDNTGGDSQGNCDTYGRLYNWATAMTGSGCTNTVRCSTDANFNHQGICPDGWHIPSGMEWQTLMNFVDGTSLTAPATSTTAGKKLKTTSDWNNDGNGIDDYGFAALPGGNGDSGSFVNVGSHGFWWSATEDGAYYAYYRYMGYDNEYANWFYNPKSALRSVRCVMD